MKTKLFRFTLYAIIVYLTCLNSAVVSAPPSEENDVHFCGFDHWQRDNRRYARTFAANLNAGEPRTVRLIYFLPNDRSFRPGAVQNVKNEIRAIQAFYATQMKGHGHGLKTFRVETNAQNEPIIHRVMGQHPESHYLNDAVSVVDEIGRAYNLDANIYLIAFDNSSGSIGLSSSRIGGLGNRRNKIGGFAIVPSPFHEFSGHIMAHELGHAFGLYHDFNNPAYIMSYGAQVQSRLSACHAEFLAVHPYFNPDSPIEEGRPSIIELISPLTYPAGSHSVSVELKLSDPDGLHQVFLFNQAPFEVWGCRGLAGNKDTFVKFDFDGYSGKAATFDHVVGLSDRVRHWITVMAVDTAGNVSSESFLLEAAEWTRPHPRNLEKISGDNQQGPAHAQLVQPLVVEVRDQNDNPLSGVLVTFAVIVGEGKLSGRYVLENAMTDANGRAEKTFTVGTGTNIVEVAVQVESLAHSYDLEEFDLTREVFSLVGVGEPTVPTMASNYRTWHLPAGATMRVGKGRIGGSGRAVAFSPDGQLLAVASSIGVWLYDAATSCELALLPSLEQVYSVAFSADAKTLASAAAVGKAGWSRQVNLWDLATRTHIATFVPQNLPGPVAPLTSVSISPDGKTVAFTSKLDGSAVSLWNVSTGSVVTLEEKYAPEVFQSVERPRPVLFSPDGSLIASGTDDGTVKLWDVSSQTQIAALTGHRANVNSVSFSPDGRLLASGSSDETVRLWDVLKKKNIGTLRGHKHRINSVSFSYDGSLLASGALGGDFDATIKLWDVATGRNMNTFPSLREGVNAVSFSPDGSLLASGARDGTVKLWDVASGNVALQISGHESEGNAAAFSPDGSTLASGSGNGTVKLWTLRPDEMSLSSAGVIESGLRLYRFRLMGDCSLPDPLTRRSDCGMWHWGRLFLLDIDLAVRVL